MQVNVSLNPCNFCTHYIVDWSSSELSQRDQDIAMLASLILGAVTFFLPHIIVYGVRTINQCLNPPLLVHLDAQPAVVRPESDRRNITQMNTAELRIPHEEITALPSHSKESLAQLQQEVEKRGLSLHVCPKLPEKEFDFRQNPITGDYIDPNIQAYMTACKGKTEEEITAFAPFYAFAKRMITLVGEQYISMEKFEKALSRCIGDLNQALRSLKTERYALGMTHGKSTQWVASLALKTLERLPNSEFSLGRSQGTVGLDEIPEAEFGLGRAQEEVLVIFDDGCYSGDQMVGNLYQLTRSLRDQKVRKTIFVVVPFMTNQAYQKIMVMKCEWLDIKIITSNERLLTLREVDFTSAEKKLLEHYFAPYFPDVTLSFTAWRRPDARSFLNFFGFSMWIPRLIRNELYYSKYKGPEFIPAKIPRPYEFPKERSQL